MTDKKIPGYAVCGADAQERLAFYHRFCKAENPLYIQVGNAPSPKEAQPENTLWLDGGEAPARAGRKIAERLERGNYDAVWIDWDDCVSIEHLIDITRQEEFERLCNLRRIVYSGERESIKSGMGEALQARLAQCDLLVVEHGDRRSLRELSHLVTPLQPNIRLLSLANTAGIAAALHKRDTRHALQFLFLVLGVAAIFMGLEHVNYTIPDTMAIFLGTYLQALPFLMLGILLSSAIQVFVPADLLQRIFPKRLLTGMLFGVLGGFMLPICDCASIPVFRSLVRKGVPLPAAVTFMIAAPIINPVVMLSTYYAYGGSVTIMLMRMSFGIVCSIIIGLCFAADRKSIFLSGAATPVCACGHVHVHDHSEEAETCGHTHVHEHEEENVVCVCGHDHEHEEEGAGCACGHVHTRGHRGVWGKLEELIAHFQAEFFEVVRFLLFGIGVSTVLQLVMGSRLMNLSFSNLAVSMLIMMALAFFLSLCSSSDAVVGKNMGSSLPMGAVMSFMVFGPMIDVKNLILMGSSFTKAFMVKLLIVTFTVSFVTVYLSFSLGLGALIA